MIPENPEHRTEAVMGTHRYVEDNPLGRTGRLVHADALEDAGANTHAAFQRLLASPSTENAGTWLAVKGSPRVARWITRMADSTTNSQKYPQSVRLRHGRKGASRTAEEYSFSALTTSGHLGLDTGEPDPPHRHETIAGFHESAAEVHEYQARKTKSPNSAVYHGVAAMWHRAAAAVHRHLATS